MELKDIMDKIENTRESENFSKPEITVDTVDILDSLSDFEIGVNEWEEMANEFAYDVDDFVELNTPTDVIEYLATYNEMETVEEYNTLESEAIVSDNFTAEFYRNPFSPDFVVELTVLPGTLSELDADNKAILKFDTIQEFYEVIADVREEEILLFNGEEYTLDYNMDSDIVIKNPDMEQIFQAESFDNLDEIEATIEGDYYARIEKTLDEIDFGNTVSVDPERYSHLPEEVADLVFEIKAVEIEIDKLTWSANMAIQNLEVNDYNSNLDVQGNFEEAFSLMDYKEEKLNKINEIVEEARNERTPNKAQEELVEEVDGFYGGLGDDIEKMQVENVYQKDEIKRGLSKLRQLNKSEVVREPKEKTQEVKRNNRTEMEREM